MGGSKKPYASKSAVIRYALIAGLAVVGMINVHAQAQTLLSTNARYPRIRLLPSGELIATVLASPRDYSVKVYSSTDNGASFTQLGSIDDPEFLPKRTSSPSLFRVPQTIGSLAAGTLILGLVVDTSGCDACRAKINIYKSTDNGRNWRFVSVAVRSANSKGLWEPDFSVAADGAIVMHYADESSSCCSQKLVRRRTYDGIHWIDQSNTVALSAKSGSGNYPLRPGMPVVSKLSDGGYLMTYEVCGQPEAINCEVHYKTSADGWDYGATNTIGARMRDARGRYFTGTPVNQVLPDGALLLVGHFLREAKGDFSGLNGQVIFKSASGSPEGPWTTIPAPVTIADPRKPGCEGFSPGLQGIASGATLVELTSRRNAAGHCDIYFGTGPTGQDVGKPGRRPNGSE